MNSKLPAQGLLLALFILVLACSNKNKSTDSLIVDSFQTLPLQTVFEFTESDDIAFRFISSMQMDEHGNILISDPTQPTIFMFGPKGNLTQKIGKRGRGPGEFQNISSFLVTSDSITVIDGRSYEIEIFEYQNSTYDYYRTINVENQKRLGNLIGLTDKGILIKNDMIFSPAILNDSTKTAISLLGYGGKDLQDTLFTVPIHEFVIHDSDVSFVRSKIYGNSLQLAYDAIGDKIYSLWTETLSIDYFTHEGEKQHAFSYPLQPVAVTKAEQDSVLNRLDKPVREVMRKHIPDVKPIAGGSLIVDDQQRIWVELLTKELGHGWFAFSQTGDPLYRIEMPSEDAFLQDIRGNTILWNYTNEVGAPTIVKSKMDMREIKPAH